MQQRLQKILSARGVASRRKAEEMIQAGRVFVNGTAAVLGASADEEIDVITIDGVPLEKPRENVYLMLHKPRGYVTTLSDEKGRASVSDLVRGCGRRVYPIGRLDMDSEGLLLLTDDGELANRLMHPSHQVDKVYRVLVEDYSDRKLEALKIPIELDGRMIAQPGVALLGVKGTRASIEVTIHEGRNRQVRRMCQNAHLRVLRLKRVSEGPIALGDLAPGAWRPLTADEVGILKNL